MIPLNVLGEAQEKLNSRLVARQDPGKAVGQQRYMKSRLPFYGLTAPVLKEAEADWFKHDLVADPTPDYLRDLALFLAQGAARREEVYVAMHVLEHSALAADIDKLETIEQLILLHPWWDVTDTLQRPLRKLLLNPDTREFTVSQISDWTYHESFWLRREAIISQLTLKSLVDRELLVSTIEPNRENSEFFVAKAIGWALRDYARTEPDWVRAYVANTDLRPLSKREALKHIGA